MAFADQLRELMTMRGLKAVELARSTGLSEAAISDYLKGKKEPRGRQSIAIAKALGVSLDTLWETNFGSDDSANNVENKQIIARNILYYMEKAGKDRAEICRDLDIKYSTLAEWLNGKKYPRIDKIERLAKYFGIKKSDLIEDRHSESTSVNDIISTNMQLSSRDQEHIKKYQSLNETGKDQVDSYTDYILNNPANRREQTQEAGKKGERMCEVTSLQDENGNEDIVRVAVYDSDGKIVGYDLVTREVYEKLEELGFTVGQERELRVAQPTDAEVNQAIEDYLKQQEDEQ